MGNRLSKITTRTGDDGTTGLGDGSRTTKGALRIEVLGDVDETSSVIGVLLTEPLDEQSRARLLAIQHHLFDLGGEVCIPGTQLVGADHVAFLDAAILELNAALPALKEFILPGGTRAAALCHQARTVARRAERSLARLAATEPVSPDALRYLNRLSDLLFIAARSLNRNAGIGDVLWRREPAT
ncbi:MAG TPA: cob(I)yrinic acid a,c-diamide adenosyltransferase [Usitatibacteraceae bacterium]|nr:cob(I)yrinic acid a,c-diamide adenosyltransferase [Usitatibacteraceae bacterium]